MPLSLIIVVTMKEGAFVRLKLRVLRSTILPSKQAQTGHAQTGAPPYFPANKLKQGMLKQAHCTQHLKTMSNQNISVRSIVQQALYVKIQTNCVPSKSSRLKAHEYRDMFY